MSSATIEQVDTASEPRGRTWLRVVGLTAGLGIGLVTGNRLSIADNVEDGTAAFVTFAIAIGGIGYVLGPHLSWKILREVRHRIASASTLDLVATGLGLAFGALVALLLAVPLSYLPGALGNLFPVVGAVCCVSLMVAVTTMRKDDLIASWLPGLRKTPHAHGAQPFVVDTNVLIDGRLVAVLQTNALTGALLVPRFVIDELQRIADSDDHVRRQRGSRGLDVLGQLRTQYGSRLRVVDESVPEEREVDAKLTRFARNHNARILTNDYNLDRIARVQQVETINLNALANALRPMVASGEQIELRITQPGREPNQGVGFLDDGTMVVVEGGLQLVGQQIPVTVTRAIQTGTGRIVFASPRHAA